MGASLRSRLKTTLIPIVLFCSIVEPGTASSRDTLGVSLRIQPDLVAVLTVYNLSAQRVDLDDSMFRVFVYAKTGEAPTTLLQRQLTQRLRDGEAPRNMTLNVSVSPILWPTGEGLDWFDRRFSLFSLYELSSPGTYTAFAEVLDPKSQRWLRSKTVTFTLPPE
jgi:hypothetical protein